MTLAAASKLPTLNRKELKIAGELDAFSQRYRSLHSSEKKAYLPTFIALCKKAQKRPLLFKKIAELFLILEARDQKTCAQTPFPEFEKHVIKQLQIPKFPCFYPLFLLADECFPQAITPSFKQMPPLYRSLITVLHSKSLQLNQLIENKLPPLEPFKADLPLFTLPFDRTGHMLRQGICTAQEPPFYFAATTTHQRLHALNQTIETDPYADDGAAGELRLENETIRFLSITDGGGSGNGVVHTAERINRLFLTSLAGHAKHVPTPDLAENLLLRATFHTQRALREEPDIQHATHAAVLAVITDRNERFVAVSQLGDTIAFLLTETDEATLVKPLTPLEISKQTSHTGGDFSPLGDYSSLLVTSFNLPKVKRACLILGTDGLADNLDPRNSLKPELPPLLDANPDTYYAKQTIDLPSRKISNASALMNPKHQKDPHIFNATHLYATPWSLQTCLAEERLTPLEKVAIESLSIDASQTWHGPNTPSPETLTALIELYAQIKIRMLYNASTPENFAHALASEARSHGKADDILIAVTWLTD